MKNQHKNPPTKAFSNNVKWRDLRLMMRVQAIKDFSRIEIKEQKQMKTYSYNHFLFFCFILGAFLLGFLSPAYALSIITTKEIDANLPNGAIESRVVLGKMVFKVEAHGFYFKNNATNSN